VCVLWPAIFFASDARDHVGDLADCALPAYISIHMCVCCVLCVCVCLVCYLCVCVMMIVHPRETPPHTRTARAQPSAAHRRRHSRPHHRRHEEHSPTARQLHSNLWPEIFFTGYARDRVGDLIDCALPTYIYLCMRVFGVCCVCVLWPKGAPLRLPKPLSDQFPVRVCSCLLCIINRLRSSSQVTGQIKS